METASGPAHSASVGAPAHTMRIPPAYQVAAPFGVDIGGVNPQFFPIRKEAQFDSWLTAGGTSQGDTVILHWHGLPLAAVASGFTRHSNLAAVAAMFCQITASPWARRDARRERGRHRADRS
jgi:hypothetical protein